MHAYVHTLNCGSDSGFPTVPHTRDRNIEIDTSSCSTLSCLDSRRNPTAVGMFLLRDLAPSSFSGKSASRRLRSS